MKFDSDVNYAADPYGYKPQRGQRRGYYALGFALVGVVAFAGVVVMTYGGQDGVTSEGGIPLLTADATPTKMRPEQPGGMQVLHQDKLVYERLSEGGNRPGVERLLPPPEEPLPRPVVTPQVPSPPPLPQAPVLAQLAPPPGATATVPREPPPATTTQPTDEAKPGGEAKPAVNPAAVPAPTPVPQAATQAASPKLAPAAVAALPSPPKPAAQPAPATPAALPAPAPTVLKPPATTPTAPAATPAKPPAVAGGAGGWRVQLASVRSEAEASAEWKRLSGRYADALGGLSASIVKADLGDKGIYYRVQGVGLDETRARSICAQLKAQNVGCVIVRP